MFSTLQVSDLHRYGGAKGTRTPDPHTASVVRYQLRHSPVFSSISQAVVLLAACLKKVTPLAR